ncbi:MAG: gliding motility-associated C-terminal domain-containing protein [Flavobacteriales bacterium]|nr:gliding motility-associated C-terminal domain-containing protein [Flavobacteriales bacterium]
MSVNSIILQEEITTEGLQIRYIAEDTCGGFYISDTLLINFCIEIYIPSVFTPNEDGINDVFQLSVKGITKYTCRIYSRWGGMLTEFDQTKNYWDGTTSSKNAGPEGVYFYQVNYTQINGIQNQSSGYLHLIR